MSRCAVIESQPNPVLQGCNCLFTRSNTSCTRKDFKKIKIAPGFSGILIEKSSIRVLMSLEARIRKNKNLCLACAPVLSMRVEGCYPSLTPTSI